MQTKAHPFTLINDFVNTRLRLLKRVYVDNELVGFIQPALTYDRNMNIIDNPSNRETLAALGESDLL